MIWNVQPDFANIFGEGLIELDEIYYDFFEYCIKWYLRQIAFKKKKIFVKLKQIMILIITSKPAALESSKIDFALYENKFEITIWSIN